jgi:predicted hotdog family 3-hydroxylacyl-ACP dehydratase
MCLLDRVVEWDRDRIVCESARHRDVDNPLRTRDGLSSLSAIEFAAQAMAIHRGLATDSARPSGYGLLISVRDVVLGVERLDELASPLVIDATRIAASADAITYRFVVGDGGAPRVTGRASVLLVEDGTR